MSEAPKTLSEELAAKAEAISFTDLLRAEGRLDEIGLTEAQAAEVMECLCQATRDNARMIGVGYTVGFRDAIVKAADTCQTLRNEITSTDEAMDEAVRILREIAVEVRARADADGLWPKGRP